MGQGKISTGMAAGAIAIVVIIVIALGMKFLGGGGGANVTPDESKQHIPGKGQMGPSKTQMSPMSKAPMMMKGPMGGGGGGGSPYGR